MIDRSDPGVVIHTTGGPPMTHKARLGDPQKRDAGWHVGITCDCELWTRWIGPFGTPQLARRVARGFHRRHRRAAERGVLTVAQWGEEPEQVAQPDDERVFLREAARAVVRPPQPASLWDGDGPQPTWPTAPGLNVSELHPSTLKDLELFGEPA